MTRPVWIRVLISYALGCLAPEVTDPDALAIAVQVAEDMARDRDAEARAAWAGVAALRQKLRKVQ